MNGHTMMMRTTTTEHFGADVLRSPVPVLVDFWAEWCMPCKMQAPALEELAKEFSGRLTVAKLNADDHPNVAAQYGVRGLPTLILFDGGKPVANWVGVQSKRTLQSGLANFVKPE